MTLSPSSTSTPLPNAVDGIGMLSKSETHRTFFDQALRVLFGQTQRHLILVGDKGVGQSMVLDELQAICSQSAIDQLSRLQFSRLVPQSPLPGMVATSIAQQLLENLEDPSFVGVLELGHSIWRGIDPREFDAIWALLGQLEGHCVLFVPSDGFARISDRYENVDVDFSVLELPEPSCETCMEILVPVADQLCEHMRVSLGSGVLEAIVRLSDEYVFGHKMPGKAIRILKSLVEDAAFKARREGQDVGYVDQEHVIGAISHLTGITPEALQGRASRAEYREAISQLIYGQDEVIEVVATELGLIKSGFKDSGKPASVMLFVGQTGTGKTELAKVLAKIYSRSKRLRTYTLGNFVEPHSVAGLIGVPPGYVGHEQGGQLVNDLLSDPYCVFLLDEADKAHPDVLQPLLNLFDEGWIKDQRNQNASANQAIFILTTNVGQRMISDMFKQGKSSSEIATRIQDTLAKIKHGKANRPVFAPEFLARVQRIVVFRPLDEAGMLAIAKRQLTLLAEVWMAKRQKRLIVEDRIVERIGREAFEINKRSEGREGGRIVAKLVRDLVEAELQQAVVTEPEEYAACTKVRIVADSQDDLPEGNGDSNEFTTLTIHFES